MSRFRRNEKRYMFKTYSIYFKNIVGLLRGVSLKIKLYIQDVNPNRLKGGFANG